MSPSPQRSSYDIAVVGGGHNGLTAAAYLARAGLSVLVLERSERVGGAAISAQAFPDFPTRLSRYSYLVSLLPDVITRDLELDIALARRRTASYSPYQRDGVSGGLLVERDEGERTRASFAELTGGDTEYDAWRAFYAGVSDLARAVSPTLTAPLPSERELREVVDAETWRDVVERPLGEAIERRFSDDLVRGVVGTDALIGTFASLHDPSLVQNRCFLYHLIGNGTGEWRVPIGGMGAVTGALEQAARRAGTEIRTGAEVTAVETGAADDGAVVRWRDGGDGREHAVEAGTVLANVAPWVLHGLLGRDPAEVAKPEGSQLKINLLLSRLPRLCSGADPAEAFAGTLHLAETYGQVEAAYAAAAGGRLPDPLPGEVYCHSLTDPSILGDVPEGTHTLTYFGLHTPASLFTTDPEATKAEAVRRALAALDEQLLDPIDEVVLRTADGTPCIEAKTPADIEADLAMPGGHIFHGDLEWPWTPARAAPETPAEQWGVQTDLVSVLMCGSGARRGGAVSGLGGHNAAQAVLERR
ncbi:NAD(P)/FAD-dependent oxidoreductase [Nocardioides sp. BGMRC 2183]|nr:NAD(P)/FAD-dependent oxidoreductase [Nocardioides sp. BGMRC 2183]